MKNELRNIISGKNQVRYGTIISTIASYLGGSTQTSKLAKNERGYKKQETEVLKEYVVKNNLWVTNIDTSNYVSEGAEQKVYLKDGEHVLKLNDGIFYNSWQDYFNNLLLHNFYFDDTAYELLGFLQEENILYAVVKQNFVKATEKTNLETVKEFLTANEFVNTRNNDYFNINLGIVLEDLHDENVLTKNGVLYFIDTVFFITDEFYQD
ncbi:MAG: hypothetical protein ABL940_09880 [Bacteroidia bacterium]